MTSITPADLTTLETLNRIWAAHKLGKIQTSQPAKRGQNNIATIINDTHVIRFDVLNLDEPCRYNGEVLAYSELTRAHIPAPDVIALDTSKQIIPYNYIILTKCDGIPLIDAWSTLSGVQQTDAARSAGQILAAIHSITLDDKVNGFGRLNVPDPTWRAYVERFFYRHAPSLRDRGIFDTSLFERMQRVIERMGPILDSVITKQLVHWDYQFENVLYHNEKITAIIDFEWSLAGDPVWDFKLVDQWDSDCAGSTNPIIEGYTSVQPFGEDHLMRRWLYKMVWHLDFVDSLVDGASSSRPQIDYHYARTITSLTTLESLLS